MSRSRSAANLAALAALVLAAGCSKRITESDASYTTLEGVASPDCQLVVWRDDGTLVETFQDVNNTPLDFNDDVLVESRRVFQSQAGLLRGSIIDRTLPSSFSVYRRGADEGWLPAIDTPVTPALRIPSIGLDAFEFDLPGTASGSEVEVQARGLLEGRQSAGSVLSNRTSAAHLIEPIWIMGPRQPSGDSLFFFEWHDGLHSDSLMGYWIHVYEFKPEAGLDARIGSSGPSPLVNAPVNTVLLALIPPDHIPVYVVGRDTVGTTFYYQPPLFGRIYHVRMTAISKSGRLVGASSVSASTVSIDYERTSLVEGRYLRFHLGAARFSVTR